MKFTNVKQLIIKFMGGGLINFPTRFLRWVKIDGTADGEDDGGGGGDDSGGSSQEELDFINQAVNIIKNSIEVIPMSINAWNNIKSEIPETVERIGDENNADYVINTVSLIPGTEEDYSYTIIFLTEDEFNIVWNTTIVSVKSYLKGYMSFNDDNGYIYYDDDVSNPNYLNFDFVFLVYIESTGELIPLDDIDVGVLPNIDIYNSNGYVKLYVPYTELNNNFLFKINPDTRVTSFTKSVYIDTQNPEEINGVNYYPIKYQGGFG